MRHKTEQSGILVPKQMIRTKAAKKTAKTARPAHRPCSYRAEFAEQAYRLSLLGLTNAELADFFDVAVSTVSLWMVKHPEFSEAMSRGKLIADAKVAEALYKRAIGYTHPDVHVSNYKGEITLTDIEKHYPPDAVALSLWLRNRQPRKRRDKIEW